MGNLNKFINKRKVAFTLAEVLITLGIIGVVAILTVPNLVSNYQKKVYVTQLQKGYSQLQQAFALAMADDEVEDMRDTVLMNNIPIDGYFHSDFDVKPFVSELKKYMKISKFCEPTGDPQNNSCFSAEYKNFLGETPDPEFRRLNRLKIYTPSGITYTFHELGIRSGNSFFIGGIEIDVNGDKKPNRLGYDLFSVVLLYNGDLIFPGSQLWADSYGSHWSSDGISTSCLSSSEDSNSFWIGDYCGGRIFDNGWVMDY